MGKDKTSVERRITIDAPASAVYERLIDFHNWQSWSPWEGMDPNQERTYSGPDAGIGAHYAWSGNRKVGQGAMEIIGVEADRRVEIALHFLKPFKAENVTTFTLEPAGGGTTVSWHMKGEDNLGAKIMGLFTSIDKMVGPDFEQGLANLKAEVEGS